MIQSQGQLLGRMSPKRKGKVRPNSISYIVISVVFTLMFSLSAVQCRLDCDSGYVSDLTPVFECTGGNYEPETPNNFFCKPAVALVISDTGEREILSTEPLPKCDQLLSGIPNKAMRVRSIDLLDNELILGATTVGSEANWRFMSLHNPRAGLLTNQWTHTKIVGLQAPRNHVTFSFGKSLVYFGGDFKSQSLLQNGRKESGEWTPLKLLESDTKDFFDKFTSHACSTKLDQNKFLVIGGTHTADNGNSKVIPDVFEVNILERKVQKLGEMNRGRTQHACAMISKSISDENGMRSSSKAILISGGVRVTNDPQTIIRVVELFILDNAESVDLSNEMLEPRFKHQMIKLGEEVLALGGRTENEITKSIEKFNFNTDSDFDTLRSGRWEAHLRSLRSSSTSNLAVTALPESAVECNTEVCQCGVPPRERIIGGTKVGRLLPHKKL